TISHRLEIAGQSADGRFARFDGDPAVFLIAGTLGAMLEAPMLDRAALALPLAQISSVELSAEKTSRRIEQRGSGFEFVAGSGDAARAERLVRVLATLHANRVVGYGKPDVADGFDKPQLRVLVRLNAGRSLTLLFGGDQQNDVWVRRTDLDATFQIPRASLDALLERTKS
ncbi:MAG TPA: DUF4340 domain-containing protein, partial [Polyangiales bacterium]